MPPAGHLLAFALISFVLIVVPGPNVLFVISRSLMLGRAAGVSSAVGGQIGVYAQVAAVRRVGGDVTIDPTPQEVPWSTPLDEDYEHAEYDPDRVSDYFAAATRAGLVLAEFRAAFRGRKTPVNAWWGSFDLAVSLFSGAPADPPSDDFIMRNSMDAQDVAVGWWPGDARYGQAAFYAYAHPAPEGFGSAALSPPAARWAGSQGLFVLDWDDVIATPDPHATALEFARSAFRHACAVCAWDPALAATAEGKPPPVV